MGYKKHPRAKGRFKPTPSEEEIIREFEEVHRNRDKLPEFNKAQLKIHAGLPKDADYNTHTLGVYRPAEKAIYLGSKEEDTLSTLWHETMHDILTELEGSELSKIADKLIVNLEKLTQHPELDDPEDPEKLPVKDSVMHEIQYFFFGESTTKMNYRAEKKYPGKARIIKELGLFQ